MGMSMSRGVRMAVTRIVLVIVAVLMVMVVMVMVMVFPAGGGVTIMRSVMFHPFRDP
jgi:hypothetical protein